MNQKICNTLAIGSLTLGILNFLSIVILTVLFVTERPIALHLLILLLIRTVFWFWPILFGTATLRMIAKNNGKNRVRKSAVSGIVLGSISGIVEIGMFFWILMEIKIHGF